MFKYIAAATIAIGALSGCGKRPDIEPVTHFGHSLSQSSKEVAWACVDKSVARQLNGTAEMILSLQRIEEICWSRAAEIDKLKSYQQRRQSSQTVIQ